MSNYLRVSVSSLLFFILLPSSVWSQFDLNRALFDTISCAEAQKIAMRNFGSNETVWIEPLAPNGHDALFESDPESYFKNREKFDSLLLSDYSIRVMRTDFSENSWLKSDINQKCYNNTTESLLDSLYGDFFLIRIKNRVAIMNGNPPLLSEDDLRMLIERRKKN